MSSRNIWNNTSKNNKSTFDKKNFKFILEGQTTTDNQLILKFISSSPIILTLHGYQTEDDANDSTYFKMMVSKGEDKIMPLLEFALGIEVSQIIIVFGILVLGTFLDFFTRVSKRDWILVASSIVIGISFQMMLERIYW